MSDSAQITESQTFTWEIENFSKLAEPKDTSYFYSANIDNKFFLRLYPQYEIRHMLNHVVVYLHRGPPYGKEVSVNCKIAVIDASGEKQFAEEIKTDFNDKNKGLPANGGLFYLSRDYLLDRSNRLLSNDRLTIFCEVEVQEDESSSSTSSQGNLVEPNPLSKVPTEVTEENRKVIGDLDTLLESGKFSDVTLVIGDQQFNVHKAILAARSPVLETMFTEETLELAKGTFELTDVAVAIAGDFLRYIYTGLVPPLNEEHGKDVFIAANKYQLESLQIIAEDALCSSLTIETVVDILLLSDTHNSSKIKSKCIKYITENAREVMATEAWAAMGQKRPLLLMQLYQDLVQLKK